MSRFHNSILSRFFKSSLSPQVQVEREETISSMLKVSRELLPHPAEPITISIVGAGQR